MDITHPQNAKVLKHLSLGKRDTPAFAPRDSVEDAYYKCGCHLEIVERVWDKIGAALPTDCCCLVHGTPALVHPKAGVILAIGIGTQYGFRLPGSLSTEAAKMGTKTYMTWSGGGDMDTRRDLGEDWVFGVWLVNEFSWCRRAYESFDHAA